MTKQVNSRLANAPARLVPNFSVAGNGLPERLRSGSIALLGTTAAVGLTLIAIAVNVDLPRLYNSAIPAPPRQAVHRSQVVAGAAGHGAGFAGRRSPAATGGSTRPVRDSGGAATPQLSNHRTTAVATEPEAPGAGGPGGHGGPAGTPPGPAAADPGPAAASPGPAPTPTAPEGAPPATEVPPPPVSSPGHGKARGHEAGHGHSGSPPGQAKPKHSAESPAPPPATAEPPAPTGVGEGASGEQAGQAAGSGSGNGHGHAYGHGK